MITRLTAEQEAAIEPWRNRWLQRGLDCNRITLDTARDIIFTIYGQAQQKRPHVILCDSPLTSLLAIHACKQRGLESLRDSLAASLENSLQASLWNSLGNSLRDSLWASLGNSLGNSLVDSLWKSLAASLENSLWDSLGASLRTSLWNSLRDSLWASLGASLGNSLGTSLRDSLRNSLWEVGAYGSEEAYWMAFYRFVETLGIEWKSQREYDLLAMWEKQLECGWWWPYRNICVVSQKPTEIHMDNNVLHHDGGPAVRFADGWSVWALHGVRVPEWLAVTRDVDIDPAKLKECDNAEVRREFVRKVGLDRIYHKLGGKCLEAKHVEYRLPDGSPWSCLYKLVELDYGHGAVRRVLEMDSASLPEVKHVEYVPRQCASVEAALNFRWHRDESQIDDKNGADWYLHGDVIVTPHGAKCFKRRPMWIT